MSIENPFNNPPSKELPEQNEAPVQPERSYVVEKSQAEKDQERYEQWMLDHPETPVSQENLREAEPEIIEFNDMIVSFEAAHSLEELRSITEIRTGEEVNFPLRESAKNAIIPIVAKMNALEKETNISSQAYSEVRMAYKRIRNAIGAINGLTNKVDHNR